MTGRFNKWWAGGLVVLVFAGCTSDADQTAADEPETIELASPADADPTEAAAANPCAAPEAVERKPETEVAANPCAAIVAMSVG